MNKFATSLLVVAVAVLARGDAWAQERGGGAWVADNPGWWNWNSGGLGWNTGWWGLGLGAMLFT